MPFSEVVENFKYGTNQKCSDEQSDDTLPVLRIPNVIGACINWYDLKFAKLPENELNKLRLRPGDILFVRTNGNPEYIGRCAVFDGNRSAAYASYLIRARLSSRLSPMNACQHFTHPRYRPTVVRAGRTTAGNFNLSTQGLGNLPLMIPSMDLQAAYAEQVQRIEALARSLDAAAAKAEALAAALSAEIFDGQTGAQSAMAADRPRLIDRRRRGTGLAGKTVANRFGSPATEQRHTRQAYFGRRRPRFRSKTESLAQLPCHEFPSCRWRHLGLLPCGQHAPRSIG